VPRAVARFIRSSTLANDSTPNAGAGADELAAYFAGSCIYGDDSSGANIAASYLG
jgi:hypothetical protein